MSNLKELRILNAQIQTDAKLLQEELNSEDIDWEATIKEISRLNDKMKKWGKIANDIIDEANTKAKMMAELSQMEDNDPSEDYKNQ